ncbi:hypothetical protein KIPB_003977 [Kipferlia bialata]|uniref:Metallo-beta-lactamase domain-containing protein n=1 Tax=Kipferlia bialata TaxID=797122 RepID=A0A9K3CVB0_9EUKA|nr:hypothetical protein KIPB_003977 [Kipferlia bialata]|eukprot:g3977.t1
MDIDADRCRSAADSETVSVDSEEYPLLDMECLHMHGHAYHHCCWLHRSSMTMFTGDATGTVLKSLDSYPVVLSSPTQFDPAAWMDSLSRVEVIAPQRLCPAHFECSEGPDVMAALNALRRQIVGYCRIGSDDELPGTEEACVPFIVDRLCTMIRENAKADGVELKVSDEDLSRLVVLPVAAKGILYRLKKKGLWAPEPKAEEAE